MEMDGEPTGQVINKDNDRIITTHSFSCPCIWHKSNGQIIFPSSAKEKI